MVGIPHTTWQVKLVCGDVLRWHEHLQNVLTAVALGEQLFDELEHILPRVTSSRPHLLSDGDGSLGTG